MSEFGKADLIKTAQVLGDSKKKDAEAMINGLFGRIQDELIQGNKVALPGIGKLQVVKQAAGNKTNPHTGEPIWVPEKWRVKFKAAKPMKDAINS